jgi:hypothetical protein
MMGSAPGHIGPPLTAKFVSALYPSVAGLHINCRLVVYEACQTGLTDTSYPPWGNLLVETTSAGAKCAVGFSGDIVYGDDLNDDGDHHGRNYVWSKMLWTALTHGENGSGKPDTVREALNYAADQVNALTGGYHGFDTFTWTGNPFSVVDPER